MPCLWCKADGLATDLIKALASPDTPQFYIEKALPDLFHCLDCVHEYHKLKDKFCWSTSAKEVLC